MIRIRLSEAQRSALECAGMELEEEPTAALDALQAAVHGGVLAFEPELQDELWRVLTDAVYYLQ